MNSHLESICLPNRFHLGNLTKKTLAEFRKKEQKKRRNPRSFFTKKIFLPAHLSFKNQKKWFLLPKHEVEEDVWEVMDRGCPTFLFAHTLLNQFKEESKKKVFCKNSTFEIQCHTPLPPFLGAHGFPSFLRDFRSSLKKNARVRVAMRKLLLKWLGFKKMKPANREDICTIEVPTRPVYVADWAHRTYYVFDVNTILRDITERLLLSDIFFVMPSYPRNPYTNTAFTLAQLLSIKAQLRNYGRTNWLFEAFCASSFCLVTLKKKYELPLKYSALNRYFHNISDANYIATMIDFIENEHIEHNIPFKKPLYLWALEHYAMSDIMIKWRRLCYRYYEMIFLYPDINQLNALHDSEIGTQTSQLCKCRMDIILAKVRWMKKEDFRTDTSSSDSSL
jgi:hypothetical protein